MIRISASKTEATKKTLGSITAREIRLFLILRRFR